MVESPEVAMMPVMEWVAICRAIWTELGVDFPMRSGDIPELLQIIAYKAISKGG